MKMQSQKYSGQINVLTSREETLEVLKYGNMEMSFWK
jgi:hypothetical protein